MKTTSFHFILPISLIRSILLLFSLFSSISHASSDNIFDQSYDNGLTNWLKQNVNLFGYISQAWVKTSDNDYYGPSSSSGGAWDFHESAINSYITLSDNLTLSTQLLYRTDGGPSKSLRWDYVFLDYNLDLSDLTEIDFKLGRVKNYLGFYNEIRDTPWGRSSIALPTIYQDPYRSYLLSGDGGAIDVSHHFNNWSFDLGYSFNTNSTDESLEYGIFGIEMDGKVEPASTRTYKAAVTLNQNELGHLTFQLSGGTLKYDYDAGTGFIPSGSMRSEADVLSFQWDTRWLSYTTEYVERTVYVKDFGGAANAIDGNQMFGYYHQLVYHATYKWDFVLRYENYYQLKNDKDGSKIAAANPGFPPEDIFQQTVVLGATWHYSDNLMLRSELQYHEGYAMVPRWNDQHRGLSPTMEFLSGLSNQTLEKYWTAFMIQASYKFDL